MEIDNRAPKDRNELEQMAHALANEVFNKVLEGRTLCTSVVMLAALTIHRNAVNRLDAAAQRSIGFALAAYAGELIATPFKEPAPRHEPHQFPTVSPTSIQ